MPQELILLCFVSFGAGFIDSIVGGGGLLQTPAMLVILPQYPIATLFGTTKIPSLAGTAFAGYKYSGISLLTGSCSLQYCLRHF